MERKNKLEVVDHISVPYNEDVKKLFFTEQPRNKYNVYRNGKFRGCQELSKRLRDIFSSLGYEFERTKEMKLVAKTGFIGIPVDINVNADGKQIKEIVLLIRSASREECMEKQKIITSALKELIPGIKLGYQPTSEKWGDC